MKIDITSMFFNSRIEGQTATPAWGTSIGQNKSRACRIDDFKSEVVDMVIGMTYKSVADIDKLDVSKGSGSRDIITCSVFEDVYINNKKIDNTQYVLLLVREHSKSHDGRLLISYAPYIKYNGIENQTCIELMQKLLGCSPEGCWFVYDISIKNQSELYFSAVVVNPSSPMVYSNSIKSKNRSEEWKALIPSEGESESGIKNSISDTLQQIFYGAPGTGKSNDIKQLTGEGKDGIFSKDFTFRTTFHPDSDYSSFVGAYKPVWDETLNKIVYAFRPQTFLKAYIAAWTNPEQNVALVIEEINRGNCAQVFGDIFQLLDREKNGLSKYPIEADLDMKGFLCNALNGNVNDDDLKEEVNAYYKKHYNEAFDKITNGDILALPKNLSILATMNTSDQSLFPMDSAFKRRWEWKYKPIADEDKKWKIKLSDDYELIDWWKFLSRINNVISDLTTSEDKQLGYFFCMPDEKEDETDVISAKTFVGKVIFYLWNDVFKDYAFDASCCKDKNDKEVLFAKFYDGDGEKINIDVLKHFFDSLKAENEESLVVEKKPEEQAPVQDDTSEIGFENTTETPVESVDNESKE